MALVCDDDGGDDDDDDDLDVCIVYDGEDGGGDCYMTMMASTMMVT